MLTPPIILINFKVYKQGSGERGFELAHIIDEVQAMTTVSFGICVQTVDLYAIAEEVSMPVFAQNFDVFKAGAHTGAISPLRLKQSGAFGSLLNHSECPRTKADIRDCIKLAREIDFKVVCCVKTPEEGAELLKYEPHFIAVEPPELIGGDVSVSKAQPEVIKRAVSLIGGDRLLVGAGVKTVEDFKIALDLGAAGVLLASGVVCATDPAMVLKELVADF